MPVEALLSAYLGSPVAHGLVFILGALFGSFANVCIYRMPPTDEHPRGRSVVIPGSHCGSCGTPVRWYDNVPILSYLVLRGRCRRCGAGFSPRYLLVEATTGMLFVAVYHLCTVVQASLEPVPVQLLRFAILAAFVFVLVVITFIDIDHKLILDRVTYPAIPIFYLLGTLLPGRGFREGLIGAVVGYGIVRLVADGYYYLTGREGLGYGDGKLLAVIGALLGWRAVVVSLFLGSLAGTVGAGLALIAARWRGRPAAHGGAPEQAEVALRHTEVPFGPFLAFGALVHVFLEPWLQVNFTPLW